MSDLIEGIYRLMMSSYDLPVNIGNPTEMTMLEFAKEIIHSLSAIYGAFEIAAPTN